MYSIYCYEVCFSYSGFCFVEAPVKLERNDNAQNGSMVATAILSDPEGHFEH